MLDQTVKAQLAGACFDAITLAAFGTGQATALGRCVGLHHSFTIFAGTRLQLCSGQKNAIRYRIGEDRPFHGLRLIAERRKDLNLFHHPGCSHERCPVSAHRCDKVTSIFIGYSSVVY